MRRDFGRRVIVRSSYTIHDSFALLQSIAHVNFLICLILTVVVSLRYWLNVGLATALCDVSRMFNLAHTKGGSSKEKPDQPTACGPRPPTPIRWAQISGKRRVDG
jgi:hypothetical protein